MKFALISLGFVLGLTASAGAQWVGTPHVDGSITVPFWGSGVPTTWVELAQQPGSLWRATSTPHIIEAVTLEELCK